MKNPQRFLRNCDLHAPISPKDFLNIFPEEYENVFKPADFRKHYQSYSLFLDDIEKDNRIYRGKNQKNEYFLHRFDYNLLKKICISHIRDKVEEIVFLSIFPCKDKHFILTNINRHDINNVPKDIVVPEPGKHLFTDNVHFSKPVNVFVESQKDKTILKIECLNTAQLTVYSNLLETLGKHYLDPRIIEICYRQNISPAIVSYFHIQIGLDHDISSEIIESVASDIERYIRKFIRPLSLFDIIGPAMVGPSSSHTAGANRIGNIARSIILAKIKADGSNVKKISIKLLGSFRDTGVGHKTPPALAAGLCGIKEEDPDMMNVGDTWSLEKNGIEINGNKVVFGGFTKGSQEDDDFYKTEKNSNIAEIWVETQTETYSITGFSIGGGNVEVRFMNRLRLHHTITGKVPMYLDGFDVLPFDGNKKLPVVESVLFRRTKPNTSYVNPFNSFEELLDFLNRKKMRLLNVALMNETKMQGSSLEEIYSEVNRYWEIMKNAVNEGITRSDKSSFALSGTDGKRLNDFVGKSDLFANIYGKAMAYATAVNEMNARSGLVVACPTAGSAGILPGTMFAYAEATGAEEKKILDSLLISGFLGMILFNDVSTAGADYGCQAEVGVGAAMAASAVAYAEGGDPETVIHAFILAIKNCLGLTCDPVAGLVEVPCVKRNGLYSSLAISAACMALAGVRSFISPDEVILVMRETGEKLHADFKETARGGLAQTRDGKVIQRQINREALEIFS